MNRTITALAIATAAVVGAGVLAGPASAADPAALTAAKTAVSHRIDLRLAALTRDDAAVSGAKNITADHKATLHSLITTDQAKLTDLKARVAGETTAAALKADAVSMVDDYRIFMLVGPKTRLTVAGDAEVAATAKLRTLHDTLAALVAKAKAAGKDTTAADQELADMATALAKVGPETDGQVSALLAIAPGPDATSIKAAVDKARTALNAGRSDLKTAAADAKKVRDFLKTAKA